MGKFTARDDAVLDRMIEGHMTRIVETVLPNMQPAAIILRGSFGRGEGSVAVSGGQYHFFSDYEIDVATYSSGYRTLFKRLSRQLTAELNVETSLRWVRPDFLEKDRIGPFVTGAAPHNISLYESRHGSRVLFGDDFISKSAEVDPAKILKRDGITLMLNRMAESMMNMDARGGAVNKNRDSNYWFNKTILACGEALLLSWGQYHYSYAERGRRFAALADGNLSFLEDGGRQLTELFKRATQYKLIPDPALYPEPAAELWQSSIPLIDQVFGHLGKELLGIRPWNYETYPEVYLERRMEHKEKKNLTEDAFEKLLDIYRSVRARHFPPGLFAALSLDEYVYASLPLVFHSLGTDDCAQVLQAARESMKPLGKLEDPKPETRLERDYLRQAITWYWKVYCYG